MHHTPKQLLAIIALLEEEKKLDELGQITTMKWVVAVREQDGIKELEMRQMLHANLDQLLDLRVRSLQLAKNVT